MLKSLPTTEHLLIALTIILLLSGCAKPKPAIFYPPEPATPRIQYLVTMAGASAFDSDVKKFIAGENPSARLSRAYGVAFGTGKIYVADPGKMSLAVMVFDLQKQKVDFLRGPLTKPVDIAVDERDYKFVTDTAKNSIVVFDEADKFLKSFPFDGIRPIGISVSANRLYVTDIKTGLIKVMDTSSGAVLKTFGEEQPFAWPSKAILNQAKDKLMVVQTGMNQVTTIDLDGNILSSFGTQGVNPGALIRPKSVAIDDNDISYVVDVGFQNVQLFNNDSRVLMSFGGAMSPQKGGTIMPAGIALDKKNIQFFQKYADPDFVIEYLIAVTSQGTPAAHTYSNVNIYAFGKHKGYDYSPPKTE